MIFFRRYYKTTDERLNHLAIKGEKEEIADKFYFLLVFNKKSQENMPQTRKACLTNLDAESKEPWRNYKLQPQ